MARSSVETMLPLDTFARVLGINPVHFNGGVSTARYPITGNCSDVWPQHSWQTAEEIISREEIAMEISIAEQDMKEFLGYSPFPTWESEEFHMIDPQIGWTIAPRAYKLNSGKLIASGRRAVALVEAGVTVTYSDEDGDGLDDTGTITSVTALTDVREIKIYFAGQGGDPEWEIRPVKTKSIAGGSVTLAVESWKLIDPDLWEAAPGASGVAAIDISVGANMVTTVDVYREYTDHTDASAMFYWSSTLPSNASWPLPAFTCQACGGSGCQVCAMQTQEGCFGIVDQRVGMVTPYPATYDEATDTWTQTSFSIQAEPQQFKAWYYAGKLSERYLKGLTTDPVDLRMAQAVTWIAVSRLGKSICGCTNIRHNVQELQRDMTRSDSTGMFTRFGKMDIFENPFGLHYGELRAFQLLKNFSDVVFEGSAL